MIARNTSELPATTGMRIEERVTRTATRGRVAPVAKVTAEASAAWIGRAV
jgi:hypothetical protein